MYFLEGWYFEVYFTEVTWTDQAKRRHEATVSKI